MTPEQIWDAIERSTGRARPMVVSIAEFAEILDVSRITAYRMANCGPGAGGISTIQLLGTKRVPVSEIFRLVESGDGRDTSVTRGGNGTVAQ